MARYIDKAALVAEIEKLEELYCYGESNCMLIAKSVFNSIKNIISTLEVKEVDLEKILIGFQNRYAYENSGELPSAIEIAQHFFELGLKTQKGE